MNKWTDDYLALCEFWAIQKSKDPSTKVGAVIVNKHNHIVGLGYNGFPKGVNDHQRRYEDKPTKYSMVVHAEANAILNATQSLHGCTLYVAPLPPCNECAKLIIQSGIKHVISYEPKSEVWAESFKTSKLMFDEAGVTVYLRKGC